MHRRGKTIGTRAHHYRVVRMSHTDLTKAVKSVKQVKSVRWGWMRKISNFKLCGGLPGPPLADSRISKLGAWMLEFGIFRFRLSHARDLREWWWQSSSVQVPHAPAIWPGGQLVLV